MGLFAALFITTRVFAQLHWTSAEGIDAHVPFSIHVFLTKDTVAGRAFRACYIVSDPTDLLNDYSVEYERGKWSTPDEFYQRLDPRPYIVVNGGSGLIIRNRELVAHSRIALRGFADSLYHYVTPSAIGINGARHIDVGWIFTDSTTDYPLCMLKGPSDPRYSKGTRSNPSIVHIRSENVNREVGAQTMQWSMETAMAGGPTLVKRGQVFISRAPCLR